MVRTSIKAMTSLLRIWTVVILFLGVGAAAVRAAQADAPQMLGVLLQLADEPTAQVYAAALAGRATTAQATALAQDQLSRIQQAQNRLLADLPLADAQIVYRTQRIYNGVGLFIRPDQRTKIAGLPGVVALHPLPLYAIETIPTVPALGVPTLWDHLYPGGLNGETISIGIIDTGIDYFHRHFGGPGPGYANNNPTVITDVVAGITFPTARVVGGWDFAGDSYNVLPGGDPIPRPDPDPVDCWGHGTHVAGIAAGGGVLWQGGAAYTGTYTSGLDFSQFAIGPGVAPRARLYALKVFGCTGASNLVPAALEWAVDPDGDGDFSDRLDVVNLSVGSTYGSYDDPSSIAANNAALAGVIVVAAGGNSGDVYYTVNSPGVADRVISVAATSISALAAAEMDSELSPSSDAIASFSARGPRRGDSALKPEMAAPGVSIRSAAKGTGQASSISSGTSMATPFVAGAAALLRQMHPGWTVEEIKALLLNTARYNVTFANGPPPVYYGAGRSGAGRMDVETAGRTEIIAYNASNPGQVGLSYGAPAILGSTSLLKNIRLINKGALTQSIYMTYTPIVDLPGVKIDILGSATAQLLPHNSLNVAVLLTAQAAELANLGDHTVAGQGIFPRHKLNEETGFVYVWPQQTRVQARIQGGNLLSAGGEEISALLDGLLWPESGRLDYTLTLTASVPITPDSVGLQVGPVLGSQQLHQLESASNADATPVTTTGTITLTGEASRWLAGGEVSLQIRWGSGNGAARSLVQPMDAVLRLPVYVAPRPVAAMRSAQASLDIGAVASSTQTIALVGHGLLSAPGVQNASFPTDTVSVAAALELQYSSPNEESSSGLLEHADLKYVGVGSDLQASGSVEQARILFGVATYGEWSSPNEVSFRILIDVDKDGEIDFALRSGHAAELNSQASRDEFFSILENSRTGTKTLAYFRNLVSSAEMNTAVFNTNVALLAVDAAALGLTQINPSFAYRITTHSVDTDDPNEIIDSSRTLVYNLLTPGVRLGNGLADLPLYYDLPGTEVSVTVDRRGMLQNQSRGILLLHLHNEAGTRAEEIGVRLGWQLYLPRIVGKEE